MWKPLGYLYDIGFTRDVWMHRVDLSHAIGRTFDATAAQDGRIATTHEDPFTLNLSGPAGGSIAATQSPRATASTWTPSTAAASSPAAEPPLASYTTHSSSNADCGQ